MPPRRHAAPATPAAARRPARAAGAGPPGRAAGAIAGYALFGESAHLPDVLHCETIAARSSLHD